MTDQYLITNSLSQDRRSQKELFERYAPYLLSIAQRYVIDRQESEDVFLKSFEKIFKNLHSYSSEKGEFKSWAKRIVIHESLNHIRKNNLFDYEDNICMMEGSSTGPDIIDMLNAEELYKIISKLKPPYATIFNMVIDGYSYSEISETLSINEATCRSYFMRSRAMLRDTLYKQEYIYHGNK